MYGDISVIYSSDNSIFNPDSRSLFTLSRSFSPELVELMIGMTGRIYSKNFVLSRLVINSTVQTKDCRTDAGNNSNSLYCITD